MRYSGVVMNNKVVYPICSAQQKPRYVSLLFVLAHKEESNNKKERYRRVQTQPVYIC